jgi:hypothetical protein
MRFAGWPLPWLARPLPGALAGGPKGAVSHGGFWHGAGRRRAIVPCVLPGFGYRGSCRPQKPIALAGWPRGQPMGRVHVVAPASKRHITTEKKTFMAKYQNKEVKIVRPAKQGDPGFVSSAGDQLVIKGDDGKEMVVPKNQVQDQGQSQGSGDE